MKANELRIGNLVRYLDGHGNNFHTWYISASDIEACETDSKQFEPIPITEEWLLKMGFIRGRFNYLWGYGNFMYDEKLKLWTWFGIQLHDYLIQHVHQLQNLYFALTGEELKLNDR